MMLRATPSVLQALKKTNDANPIFSKYFFTNNLKSISYEKSLIQKY
jgi:hypothetical protein